MRGHNIMPKVELKPIYLCDLCYKEFDLYEMNVGEDHNKKIQSITCDIWYQGIFTAKYICSRCDGYIQKAINDLHPNNKDNCSSWEKKK